ncbi:hypothetical protein [Robertmurraya sp. P23]|uniref:hypothetical protein n=1 Tax=Robertmurraya sp. P23 TaxID=3436931 RepID=UPI003D99748D
MDYVKFYEHPNYAIPYELKGVVNEFDPEGLYDINEVLQFYNISLYIKQEYFPKNWSTEYINTLKEISHNLNNKVIDFFKKINDENILELTKDIYFLYHNDFLEQFCKFKLAEKISGENLIKLVTKGKFTFTHILEHKYLVNKYENEVKKAFLENPNNAEILLNKFIVLQDRHVKKKQIHLPVSMNISEMNELLSSYIDFEETNLNYLRLIINAHGTKDFKIDDVIKLKAKRKIETEEQKLFSTQGGLNIGYMICLSGDLKEPYKLEMKNNETQLMYSKQSLEENLDYPTILQNFIQFFGYTDKNVRISLVSHNSDLGTLERVLGLNSQRSYLKGIGFTSKEITSDLQFIMYYEFLGYKNISLEEVIDWFFKEYLKKEFNIENYFIEMPSPYSKYLEKCRVILPEMESILKQYSTLVSHNEIDHELIQISSSGINFSSIPSLVKRKYVYAIKDKLEGMFFHLFSNQSDLSYIEGIEEQYETFYELIRKREVRYEQFYEHQQLIINELIKLDYLYKDSSGAVYFKNKIRIFVLHQLYHYETINFYRVPTEIQEEILLLESEGLVQILSSLFSIPEQNYFNYYLNNSQFTDGPQLRNRYSHGTQGLRLTEEEHKKNYFVILKLLMLIIIKINDDICIKEDYLS